MEVTHIEQTSSLDNEDDIAIRFALLYKDKLRFDHTRGKWFTWDDTRWKLDATKMAFDWSRILCRQIRIDNKNVKLASIRISDAVERYARADRRFAVTSEVWNTAPWLLCTPGGTIDLRTGTIHQNNPDDLITACTTVAPGAIDTPVWDKFLKDATKNDDDVARFLQKVSGYCLTGNTQEDALFFLYGFGGNGKTTFVNALLDVMGDYAVTAAMDTFTSSRGDRHPTELARLQDARLVTASETEENRAWAESRIKQLTGGEPVAARYMRQDFFEYTPKFKLLIQGNHAPALTNVDDAMRRRFSIVPFVHKPPRPNPSLADELVPEYPGVLQWMIDGCLGWQKEGLTQPSAVAEETNQYFTEQDIFRQWIEECTEKAGVTTWTTTKVLWKSWAGFAEGIGEGPGTQKAFGQRLANEGFRSQRKYGKRVRMGIAVKGDQSPDRRYPD